MAQALRNQGYRASALVGGVEGWVDAGYPTEPKRSERGRTVSDVCPECGLPIAEHALGARGGGPTGSR